MALLGVLLCSLVMHVAVNAEIHELSVLSKIISRYAVTQVNSIVKNPEIDSKEISFTVILPESAFISNFSVTVLNKTHVGQVKEKQKAKETYQAAVDRGQTAGLVRVRERDTNTFTVSVNVAAKSKAVFQLTYEELLRRKLGLYEIAISVRPQDKVRKLKVQVLIEEKAGITRFLPPQIRKNKLLTNTLDEKLPPLPSTVVDKNETAASITFTPTREEQDTLADSSGNFGDFVVLYDVGRSGEIGEIEIEGGYFVHYFAPKGLTALPKNIVFVIDVSGSMSGTKIKQTRNAMLQTLGDLKENDYFNILTFSGRVDAWKNEGLISAKKENIDRAKQFVRLMKAQGSTNINSAILTAVEHLKSHQSNVVSASLIVLLTDGDPTEGETNTDKIMENSIKAIDGKYSLFCLGFGHDVDFNFLKKLALHNGGFARKIFEDVDADLQLNNFYSEIGTPLLSELQLKYPDNKVSKTTKNTFNNYFNGSEIIVAGRMEEKENHSLEVVIDCFGASHRIFFNDTISIQRPPPKKSPPSFTERLWAYLTIKELLQKKLLADDLSRKTNISTQALSLSLRYNFVTPLTSMVVTVTEESEEVMPEEARNTRRIDSFRGWRPSLFSKGHRSAAPQLSMQVPAVPGSSRALKILILTFLPLLSHLWSAVPGSSRVWSVMPRPPHGMPVPSHALKILILTFLPLLSQMWSVMRGPPHAVPGPSRGMPVPSHAVPGPSHDLQLHDFIEEADDLIMAATYVPPAPSFTSRSVTSTTSTPSYEKFSAVVHIPPICITLEGEDKAWLTLLHDESEGVKLMVNLNKLKDEEPVISMVYVMTTKPKMQALRINGDLSVWLNETRVIGHFSKFGPIVVNVLPNEVKMYIGKNIALRITKKTGPQGQPDLSVFLDDVNGFSTQTTGLFESLLHGPLTMATQFTGEYVTLNFKSKSVTLQKWNVPHPGTQPISCYHLPAQSLTQ
uniref:inter-alpha-trypsin inhibitor heavy chain H3-like isoform X10 n=1 Tax=Myxine glutinosa TaxID=7769 RepID=UPI00358F7271